MRSLLIAIALHGLVLSVDVRAKTAIVKHDAFSGMPAMTMPFALDDADARRLRVGDEVRGDVDLSRQPWTLRVTSIVQPQRASDVGAEPPVPLLGVGDTVPDAAFIDQLGRKRSWGDLRGHTIVLSFIYTRCRDTAMCPLVSAKFGQLQRALPGDVRLVEVTLDPAYDTPSVLHRYGELFAADPKRWILATGDAEVLGRIAASFGIGVASRDATSIAHSEVLGILDRDGRVVDIVPGSDWYPQGVVAAVRAAEGRPSSPWDRFVLSLQRAAKQCGLGNMSVTHAAELLLFIAAIAALGLTVLIADFVIRRRQGKVVHH